jgi:type VI secretion system secreted protein VgrG
MVDHTKTVILRSETFVSEYVLRVTETHVMGYPAEAAVEAILTEEVPLADLVGCKAQLIVSSPDGPTRTFWGVVESAELHGTAVSEGVASNPQYTLHVVSRLALMDRSVGCRIFQDLTVKEIIQDVLVTHGYDAAQVEWKLSATYPKREYCTQYHESALNFVSRLAESEGIYFYARMDAEAEDEKLMFADKSPEAAPEWTLPLRHPSQMMAEQSAVYRLNERQTLVSGKVTLNAYDFKRPSLDQVSSKEAATLTDLELYDFSDDYVEPSEGKRLAQVRLEAEQAKHRTFTIHSDSQDLHIGDKLTIEAPDGSADYFVTGIRHRYDRQGDLEAEGMPSPQPKAGQERQFRRFYWVEATLIPLDVPYRLVATHPAPVIYGPQTATVVSVKDAQMEEIHCDEHGRCKVKFHWDLSEEFFDHASCWMRVTQLQTSGSMILPRVHWEVLVEFLEGNPDFPYITGRIYNGTFMPPYALPEGKTRTSIKTASTPGGGGTNEIRFEDKAGSEEIMIHSQYNTVINAANNRKKVVNQNETLTIGNNATLEIGSNSKTKVTHGWKHSVGANQDLSVGANRSVEVNSVYGLTAGGNASTTVGANQMEMVGNPLDGIISLAVSVAAEAAQAKAAQVMGQVQAKIQGAVGAALGPIGGILNQANALGAPLQAMNLGGMGSVGAALAGAAAIPSASDVAGAMLPASMQKAPDGGPSAMEISATNMANAAISKVAGQGLAAARAALGVGGGQDAGGAGGQSTKNVGGPDGAVSGVSEEDLAAGPGHNQYKVTGNHSETIGALGLTAAAGTILTNVTGNMTQSAGAAHVELILGNRAESTEAAKTETSAGLIVISRSDESETVKTMRSAMIGGARVESVKGNRSIESSSMVSLVGAMHKVEAKTKLTFKCGASSIVVDGSGITITSPLVDFTAAAITLKKDVADG